MSALFIIICGIFLSAMSVTSNAIGLNCQTDKQSPRYQFLVFNLILAIVVMCVCVGGLFFFVKMNNDAN